MSGDNSSAGFVAIDVGSSRVKFGWFPPTGECISKAESLLFPISAPHLPQPAETLAVSHQDPAQLWATVGTWLQEFCPAGPPGFIASVHPAALTLVQEMFANRLQQVTFDDLPIEIHVEQPERVGIDRLLSAVAVNRLRPADRAAIVVDLGTACTVDLVGADGAFEGGAILPGTMLSASALHAGTAALPELKLDSFDAAPLPVGKSTQAAITSGLYWGMVGAVRELVERIGRDCDSTPQLFLTGGGSQQLVEHLASKDEAPRHIPSLVLSGIALVAAESALGELP